MIVKKIWVKNTDHKFTPAVYMRHLPNVLNCNAMCRLLN